MLRQFDIVDGRIAPATADPGTILVYVNPDESERAHLVSDLHLDEHTLGSALDPNELSRLEFEPDHVAIIFKRPKNYSAGVNGAFLLEVASTGVFLFEKKLIVVLSDDAPVFDGPKFGRVTTLRGAMLRLIYRSIYHFLEHLKIIDKISDELQGKINTSMENRYLINLFELQKTLVYYLSSISSNGMLIERLKLNAPKIGFTPEQFEVLDDIYIENNQCYKQAEMNSNILASLMDARVSIVGNNLAILIKILNIITLAIMVPTLIVSIFSMNVRLPMQDYPHSFWMIMAIALLSVLGFMSLWRYKKW